ncbi:hypothetical protein GS682_03470 [Nostoc sp. B(2019)]|nr:hypothetical protein [Nostoc sp. B(2019)]
MIKLVSAIANRVHSAQKNLFPAGSFVRAIATVIIYIQSDCIDVWNPSSVISLNVIRN